MQTLNENITITTNGAYRFLSPDPLWEKYISWTSYHYCMNNPVSALDVNGLEPGDTFSTAKDAVVDFAVLFNGISILQNSKLNTRLYSNISDDGNKVYSYTEPQAGTSGFVPYPEKAPEGKKDEGITHTHAAYDKSLANYTTPFGEKDANIHLSDGDIYNAGREHKSPIWSVFPNGKIEMWDPKNPTKLNKIKLNFLYLATQMHLKEMATTTQ